MNYYRITKNAPIGKKLSDLFAEGRRCDEEANKLAQSIHAVSYLISPEADFGGISVVEFSEDYFPNPTVWEFIHDEEGLRSYAPKVEIKTEYLPVDQAEAFRGTFGKIVSEQVVFLPKQGECMAMMSIIGKRKAVQMYKRMQALPIVPSGAVSRVLEIKESDTRPGMLECEEYVYIQTKHHIQAEGIEVISVEEFRKVVDEMAKTQQ